MAAKRKQEVTRFSVCVICHESTLVGDLNERCECIECTDAAEASSGF